MSTWTLDDQFEEERERERIERSKTWLDVFILYAMVGMWACAVWMAYEGGRMLIHAIR